MLVYIDGINNRELNLDFLGRDIESPATKTNKVSIPMRDGDIDLTEALGSVPRFENRKIVLRFEIRTVRYDWMDTMLHLFSLFHGKKVEVVFGDDHDYKWIGRCSVGKLEDHGFTAGVNFEIDAEPFKRTVMTVFDRTFEISGEEEIEIDLLNMRGFPEFIPNDEMTVSDGTEVYTITETVNKAYGLVLDRGKNNLTFYGDGEVRVVVYGGDL